MKLLCTTHCVRMVDKWPADNIISSSIWKKNCSNNLVMILAPNQCLWLVIPAPADIWLTTWVTKHTLEAASWSVSRLGTVQCWVKYLIFEYQIPNIHIRDLKIHWILNMFGFWKWTAYEYRIVSFGPNYLNSVNSKRII